MDKAKAEKREKMQKIEDEIYNGELRVLSLFDK